MAPRASDMDCLNTTDTRVGFAHGLGFAEYFGFSTLYYHFLHGMGPSQQLLFICSFGTIINIFNAARRSYVYVHCVLCCVVVLVITSVVFSVLLALLVFELVWRTRQLRCCSGYRS